MLDKKLILSLVAFVITLNVNLGTLYFSARDFIHDYNPEWKLRTIEDKKIQILVKQASRYAVAAEQDESLGIAMLHANYGAAYMYALFDIYTEEQIKKAVDIDLEKFKLEIRNAQSKTTKKLYGTCPSVMPSKTSTFLLKASQLEIH